MADIFVSMPATGGWVHQKTIITANEITLKHQLHWHYIENSSLITKARQDHLGMFLKSKDDYLLTIDADMVIRPQLILDSMIERAPKGAIVAGLYAKKALTEKGVAPLNGKPLEGDEQDLVLDGSLVRMKYVPTGFMLVPREAALKIIEHFKELEYEDHVIGKTWAVYNTMLIEDERKIKRFVSEDFAFCLRAAEAGVEIYADTSCSLGHIGHYLYHIEHLRVEPR